VFEEEEARLSQEVVDRADAVHIMATATPEIVAPYFRIPPEKVLHVAHPSYLGAYEDRIGKLQARHELGIMPGEIVHVVLGAIRPYKGLTELLDAWDVVAADDVPRRLVIAGGPSEEPGIAEVLERAAIHPRILLHAGQIAPADIQVYLRAADVAVLPYVRTLNSGALLLALTFGLPAVVPAGGGLAELLDDASSRTFSHDDPAELVAALRSADGLATAEASAAARAIAERFAPGPLATQFARGLREKLGMELVPEGEAALTG
jgi:glycosyltransferase involved in cell wall biosynthesis